MIVALTGPAGSGKDAAAKFLCEAWAALPRADGDLWGSSSATTLALADPLRHAADELNVPPDLVRSRKDELAPEFGGGTGRGLLLELGRLVRAWLGDDHLARFGVERALKADRLCLGRLVVVTDVRREVEARLLLDAGARLVHVDRGVDPSTDALFGPQWPAIRALKPATLGNRGELSDLAAACRGAAEALRGEVRP